LQPILLVIDTYLKQTANTTDTASSIKPKLLQKVLPQLQTTHERKYHRLNTGKHRQVSIAIGVAPVHKALTETVDDALPWQLCNQSSAGLMARRSSDNCQSLKINDFIGIFETDLSVKLAIIKWLHIELNGETFIGLELIEGKPIPVLCVAEGEAQQYPALLLPSDDPQESSSMIAEKGLYSPKRLLRIKGDGEPYPIQTSGMMINTIDYEQFSYKVK